MAWQTTGAVGCAKVRFLLTGKFSAGARSSTMAARCIVMVIIKPRCLIL